jgi:hypothetical protein
MGDPSFASSTSAGFPRSVHGEVPRFAKNTAPANESAAIIPAATARSCAAAHLGRLAGSGVGARVEAGERVGAELETGVVRSGGCDAITPAGAAHDMSMVARSRSRIARR